MVLVCAFVCAYVCTRAAFHFYVRYRFEYQDRGSCHVHGCVRLRDIKDLPAWYAAALRGRFKPASLDEVFQGTIAESCIAQAHDVLISCSTPLPDTDALQSFRNDYVAPATHPCSVVDADVHDVVREVQRHRHKTSYCGAEKCRFGYPLDICEETHMEWSVEGDGRLVGARNDRWMNGFNLKGIMGWRANMDIKLIYSNQCLAGALSFACICDE
jgi:hypothetical protein